MQATLPAVRSPDAGEVAPELLRRRISLVPWVILIGNLLFAVTDPWLHPQAWRTIALVKLAVSAVLVGALVMLRRAVPRRSAIVAGLGCVAAGTVGGTVSGVMVGDPFTTPLLCTAAMLFTGTVIPWGGAAQTAAAAVALLGGALTVSLVAGLPGAVQPVVGMGVVAGLSVYVAAELARQRFAESRARLALHRHQAELAHVLRVSTMGEMGAQLAHELTQPLGAIANYAAGCRRRLEAAPARQVELIEAVDHIGREALRAGSIIRRMREFLRKTDSQRAPVDVNDLVREVAGLIDGEARAAGVEVVQLLDGQLPLVEANAVELEQVLVNLTRNALEAMQGGGTGGRLTIETRRRPPDQVDVFVRDTGPGLPDGGAAVFEPFFTTKASGLGLGLAISRTLVEMHGGTLEAQPSAAGAAFRIVLPLKAPALEVATAPVSAGGARWYERSYRGASS